MRERVLRVFATATPRGVRQWLPVAMLALAVGAAAAAFDVWLDERVHNTQQTEISLQAVSGSAGALAGIPWDYVEPGLARVIPDRLTRRERSFRVAMAGLARTLGPPWRERLIASERTYLTSLRAELSALRSGNLDLAHDLTDVASSREDALQSELRQAGLHVRQEAATSRDLSIAGSISVIALSLGLFALLLARANRSLLRAERAEHEQQDTEQQYRLLFEQNPNTMWVIDSETLRFLAVNNAAVEHYGYSQDEFLAMTMLDIRPPEDRDAARAAVTAPQTSSRWRHFKANGELIHVEITAAAIEFNGRPARFVLALDVTEKRRAEVEIQWQLEINRYQALHDSLTELPNRKQFHSKLNQALAAAERNDSQTAVLVLDVDRFKLVNDTLGHQAGDALLTQLGIRLAGAVRGGSDIVARLGGDEFGIVLASTRAPTADSMDVAARIKQLLDEPFMIDQIPVRAEASIGIAHYPEHGADARALLQHADVALYHAKGNGHHASIYSSDYDLHDSAELGLLADLPRALARHELTMLYQPKFELTTGRVQRVEALVRWRHPRLGFLRPADFIPLAEQTGLIDELSLYILERALTDCAHWTERGIAAGVAVNLSPRNLGDSMFTSKVELLLHATGVTPDQLLFELTESAIAAEPAKADAMLNALHNLGIGLAIDDYGTGFSSLAFLSRPWLDQVKVDRIFVRDLVDQPEHEAITASIIRLAHELGLAVVAEGIETPEVAARLIEMGCDFGQGYELARPLTAADLELYLEAREDVVAGIAAR